MRTLENPNTAPGNTHDPLGGLDVNHKPGSRWTLDGVLPVRTTRYALLQATVPRRDRSGVLERLGGAGACELLVDLFPVLPSVEAAADSAVLFAALLEDPGNSLRVDCKGVIGRVLTLQQTFRTSPELHQFIDEVLLPKLQGWSELETTPLGTEHNRPPALRSKPWQEHTVMLGDLPLAAAGAPVYGASGPARGANTTMRHTFASSFGARSPAMTASTGFHSAQTTMSRTAMSGFGLGASKSASALPAARGSTGGPFLRGTAPAFPPASPAFRHGQSRRQ